MPNENEGFVSRWSRRKQQVAKEQEIKDVSDNLNAEEALVEEEVVDPEQLKAEKLEALNKLTDEDMPDVETLNEDSDFSGFMSTSVSEGLRRMALKKLFMGKSYNFRDGLDEYDDDYTKFEKMPSNMVTSDMKHMIEVEAKRKREKEEEEERQRMLASGEIEEEFNEADEFDEFADDDDDTENDTTLQAEEYVDEHINVDGFDTTVAEDDLGDSNNENSKDSINKDTVSKDTNEDVA